MRAAIDATLEAGAVAEGTLCYTGDLSNPAETVYTLDYYVHLAEQAATATRVRPRPSGQWMLQRGGRRRTSSSSSPSASISASTP